MLDIRRDQDVSQAEDSMVAGIPAREEREKKKKKKRERERMVANGITGTVWYGVLLALPQTVVHST